MFTPGHTLRTVPFSVTGPKAVAAVGKGPVKLGLHTTVEGSATFYRRARFEFEAAGVFSCVR